MEESLALAYLISEGWIAAIASGYDTSAAQVGFLSSLLVRAANLHRRSLKIRFSCNVIKMFCFFFVAQLCPLVKTLTPATLIAVGTDPIQNPYRVPMLV